MAKQPATFKGLDLVPITSEVKQQKRAHRLLGNIYERADHDQLPQIRWCIGTTGTLIGKVDVLEPDAAPVVFAAWVKALRLNSAEKLRATGMRDGVHLVLTVEEA
jgi:hypothetical protein